LNMYVLRDIFFRVNRHFVWLDISAFRLSILQPLDGADSAALFDSVGDTGFFKLCMK
jgi:hypothetical protein